MSVTQSKAIVAIGNCICAKSALNLHNTKCELNTFTVLSC